MCAPPESAPALPSTRQRRPALLGDVLLDQYDRHVERASAEIEDHVDVVRLDVGPVAERRRRGLVDQPKARQTGVHRDLASQSS